MLSVISPLVESGCPDTKSTLHIQYQIRTTQNELRFEFPLQRSKDLIVEPYQFNDLIEDKKFLIVLKVTEKIDATGQEESIVTNVSHIFDCLKFFFKLC